MAKRKRYLQGPEWQDRPIFSDWLTNQSKGFVSSYHLMHSHNQPYNNNIFFINCFKVGVYSEFTSATEELECKCFKFKPCSCRLAFVSC